MKLGIWYHTAEQQPNESGYYLAYRGWGIAGKSDTDSDYGPVFYDKKINSWRDYESSSYGHDAFVYYWTDADPEAWTDRGAVIDKKKIQSNPALEIAWQKVIQAVEQYELIKALS
jgi:hypothetical protein